MGSINMNVLITGGTGFVGSHMIDYLLSIPAAHIFAIRRWRSIEDNIKHLIGNPRVTFLECDLLERGSLRKVIHLAQPDYVFHFAAQSFPETSFFMPVDTLTTNIIGTTNLLEELKYVRDAFVCNPTIVSISSSEVYGATTPEETPITEKNAIRAANPYSISKVGHDLMSQYYYSAYGLNIVITRMFSHEGARRGKGFALSSFAHQIVWHEKHSAPDHLLPIYVGNLDSMRTYAHIADAVHAYWLAATKCTFGEVYNIGGDYSCKVGDALENLLSKSIFKRDQFTIIIDKHKLRPTDITLQIPDCSKFKQITGWKPLKSFDDITSDLLNYWRQQL